MLRSIAVLPIVLACASGASAQAPPERPSAVLLISVDTLRADRLGVYGRKPSLTPNLDALAGAGLVFENAYSVSNITQPSLITLLSGLYPGEHGHDSNLSPKSLADGAPTAATLFRAAGYRTAAFMSHPWLFYARYGIDRHFQHWEGVDYRFVPGQGQTMTEEEYLRQSSAGPMTDRALTWLQSAHQVPFFAWIHYLDPHDPYTAPKLPEPSQETTRNPLWDWHRRRYDGEVAHLDLHVGRLLAAARAAAPGGRLLVVFTADHGEMLYDHAYFSTHGLYTYDSEIRVPLLVAGSGAAPSRVHAPVSLIDVLPTLAARIGAPLEAAWKGVDLFNVASAGSAGRRLLFSESEYYRGRDFDFTYERRVPVDGGKWYTVIGPDFKLVYYPAREKPGYRIEFYDLDDRRQTQSKPAPMALAEKLLEEVFAYAARRTVPSTRSLGKDQLEALRALGYIK